jgi:hypothetical protein
MCNAMMDFVMVLVLYGIILAVLIYNMPPIYRHLISANPIDTALMTNFYMVCFVFVLYTVQVLLSGLMAVRKSTPTVNIIFNRIGRVHMEQPGQEGMVYMPLQAGERAASGLYEVEFKSQ